MWNWSLAAADRLCRYMELGLLCSCHWFGARLGISGIVWWVDCVSQNLSYTVRAWLWQHQTIAATGPYRMLPWWWWCYAVIILIAEYAGSWSSLSTCPNQALGIYAFMQKPIRTFLMFNAPFHSKLDVGYLHSPTSNHRGIPVTNGDANVSKIMYKETN